MFLRHFLRPGFPRGLDLKGPDGIPSLLCDLDDSLLVDLDDLTLKDLDLDSIDINLTKAYFRNWALLRPMPPAMDTLIPPHQDGPGKGSPKLGAR